MVKIQHRVGYTSDNQRNGHWVGNCYGETAEQEPIGPHLPPFGYYLYDTQDDDFKRGYYCEDCIRAQWPDLLW